MYLLSLYLLLLLFLNDKINAQDGSSLIHRRLASLFCYIDDYSTWLEQQTSLNYFLQFAQFYDVDAELLKEELERFRLQRECLKIFERLPIIIGNG